MPTMFVGGGGMRLVGRETVTHKHSNNIFCIVCVERYCPHGTRFLGVFPRIVSVFLSFN